MLPSPNKQLFIKGIILIICLGVFTSYLTPLHAQPIRRLNHLSFNVNEGLLHSQVTDINEDGNGFIWISTGSGVQRFDGKNFQRIFQSNTDKGIPDDKYVRFFRLNNGKLLLAHSKGISEYDPYTDRFSKFGNERETFVGYAPLYEESDAIWISNKQGALKIAKSDFRMLDSIFYPPNFDLIQKSVIKRKNQKISLLVSSGDGIYVLNASIEGSRYIKPTAQQKAFLHTTYYGQDTALVATQRGIEMIDLNTGLSKLIAPYMIKNADKLNRHLVNLHRISENIFITYQGREIYELDIKTGKYLNRLVDLRNAAFVNLSLYSRFFSDSYNNLWVITENEGIRKLNYGRGGFKYYGSADKSRNFVKTIFVDKDENLVLTSMIDNGLQIFDTSQQLMKSKFNFPGNVSQATIAAITKTRKHEYLVFLMGWFDAYYVRLDNYSTKKAEIDTSKTGFKNVFDYHLNVIPVGENEWIIQNSFMVFKARSLRSKGIETYEAVELPIASTTSYVDEKNRLWVGGMAKYFMFTNLDLHSYKTFSLQDNVLVRCFYHDNAGRNWMGTEKGLYQLDDNGNIIERLLKKDGLLDENIYAIREDANGGLWFSHNRGISCLKKDGSLTNFGKNDGLQENEFNTNTSFATADGELFFGGVNGISSFYPDKILQPSNPSRLLVTSIKVQDQDYLSDSASWNTNHITLPYNQNNISFQFTAMGQFDPGQYSYKYRMSGLNENWINSNANEIPKFVLPPGDYRFQISVGEMVEANSTPMKQIFITINPPFWRATWFISLMVMAVLSIIVLTTRYLTRIKLKQRIQELEQRRALDEERLRISREMHDDIGAGLTQITMISEAVRDKDETPKQLHEIANTSRKLVGNISEIIWSLNPENNSLDEFLGYLREQLHKLLQYSGIEYEIDFPENGKNILLNNAQKRNLLLITKEIVHNAVKHSQATQISISCNQEQNSLQFIVKDNGRSFDPAIKFNGNGLSNIRRRITELSGTLNIDSSTGSGTIFRYGIGLN